ncbi:carboxyl-terminal processing protease [Clostridium pascui]|uniref:S41 family peptidase n=1 Tax=Clostridium pascui TaxID=46609 RepID=UPI0019595427|nr:S41 family peptidase [Clostridium pascui]MBM7869865.1 carboxyl-terminal processing protease [Clostridium pascui]
MKLFNMKKTKTKTIGIIASLVILISSFNYSYVNAAEGSVLSEAKNIIQSYYLNDVSNEVLNSGSVQDMVKKLNDPYSSYFTKEEYESFTSSIDNKFTGIGIQVLTDEEGIKITSVFNTSPAEEAGLKAGDIIIKADNVTLKGLSSEQAISYIKGEEGTSVHLVIQRDTGILEADVIRKQISLPTVEGEVLNNHIGYIEINSFGENTPDEFRQNLEKLEEANVESYVVDLRYNSGGYVEAAREIGGYFIGDNSLMVIKNRTGASVSFKAYKHDRIIEKPVIFLINQYSASASELLSAAVKDYKKAIFIGKTTYGKGVAQGVFPLSNGSFLKLTTYEFLSPYKNTINHVGVSPDFQVDDNSIDSLYLSDLLLSEADDSKNIESLDNKQGYIKVLINNQSFYINMNEARKDENWEAYKYLMDNTDTDNLFLGKGNGWTSFVDEGLDEKLEDKTRLLYPNSKVLKSLAKNSKDKTFTITFNREVDPKTANGETIELINGDTGQRISANIEVAHGEKVTLSLKDELQQGDYYLVVSDKVKDEEGKKLRKETVTKVQVAN